MFGESEVEDQQRGYHACEGVQTSETSAQVQLDVDEDSKIVVLTNGLKLFPREIRSREEALIHSYT